MLVALKIQNKNDISNISEDEVNAIIHTPSKDDHEMDAIIEILLHFGFTREEISETLQ
jgi:predicted metal-dependent TIM-barrel fold hydrolase